MKLNHEKALLENALEAEQECIVNKLQKQVQALQADKILMKREMDKLRAELTVSEENQALVGISGAALVCPCFWGRGHPPKGLTVPSTHA